MRYIGSKKLLLNDVKNVIDENVSDAEIFCDIFSGTVCVGNFFKQRYKIITNDLLYFSYCIQKGIIENNEIPKFKNLPIYPIEFFNGLTCEELETLPQEKRFCANNYSPVGDRMYLSEKNALKIDYIRNKINEWKDNNLINDSEYFYLIAVLIEAIPFVSNISGTYGAFNKFWDKRSLKDLTLNDLDIYNNKKENLAYNEDSNTLIKKIEGDILYIDPPYNKRQYFSNYHLLETVAKYDCPNLSGISGLPQKTVKSNYCSKKSVLSSFEELIVSARFKHIIMSYSTEGLMSVGEIEEILKQYGKDYKMYEVEYRRFTSRKTNNKNSLKELIFYIRKDI